MNMFGDKCYSCRICPHINTTTLSVLAWLLRGEHLSVSWAVRGVTLRRAPLICSKYSSTEFNFIQMRSRIRFVFGNTMCHYTTMHCTTFSRDNECEAWKQWILWTLTLSLQPSRPLMSLPVLCLSLQAMVVFSESTHFLSELYPSFSSLCCDPEVSVRRSAAASFHQVR